VNACDAMGQGGRLTITEAEAVAEQMGRVVVVQVSDTGPGVPDALQGKVFEPFFSTKEDGTGLGLSIAQRIVEEHGGRLELRSREGEGAAFIVTLPVREGSG
jgi:signal transduction histidine kinase